MHLFGLWRDVRVTNNALDVKTKPKKPSISRYSLPLVRLLLFLKFFLGWPGPVTHLARHLAPEGLGRTGGLRGSLARPLRREHQVGVGRIIELLRTSKALGSSLSGHASRVGETDDALKKLSSGGQVEGG